MRYIPAIPRMQLTATRYIFTGMSFVWLLAVSSLSAF